MFLLSQSLLLQPRSLSFFQTKSRIPRIQPLAHINRTKESDNSICFASSSKGSNSISDLVELPIYQAPLVLFPGTMLPLLMCGFRDEMLIQSLFKTDLRFGVLFSDPVVVPFPRRKPFSLQVGCVAQVVELQRRPSGCFLILCKGMERFSNVRIQRKMAPYMVSTVTLLEDKPLDPAHINDLEKLASEVAGYVNDVIRLARRIGGKNHNNQNTVFDFRKGELLTRFSLLVANSFKLVPKEQQELLEMVDTAARLEREREMLKATIKYLIDVLAVKDAFPSSK